MKWDHKQSIKEALRHYIFKLGVENLLFKSRQRRGFITTHLDDADRAERFSAIYRLGAWVHSEDQHSLSGKGSEATATAKLGDELSGLLAQLGCCTLLDIGCGDWNWMRNISLPCDYVGVDIVPKVIEANRCHERPGVRFEVADAVSGPLPEADVALCREVLFHLSFQDGLGTLTNVRKAARWLIATTDPTIWFNSDIPTGDFRKINLQRSPYRLPPPRETIADDAVSQGRVLGVWAMADLPIWTG